MRLGNARLLDGSLVDIDIASERITRVSSAGTTSADAGASCDIGGATLLPGLWDSHTHMTQCALYTSRPSVLEAASATEAAALAARAARLHNGSAPLVLVGMRDGLWPDAPDRALLDAATGGVPTLIVSSDLHCSWPNTAMTLLLGRAPSDALYREAEAADALEHVDRMLDPAAIDALVVDTLHAAAARGVVGVVDFDFNDAVRAWMRESRRTPTRVEVGVYPEHLDLLGERGLRGGDNIGERVRVNLFKVITDGSLGTRTAWTHAPYGPSGEPATTGVATLEPRDLARLLQRSVALGLEAAVHAIGDAAVTAALEALAAAGRGGRIEHAQLVAASDIPKMADARIVASVQPEHALDDRDLTDSLWGSRARDAYRLRSLIDAGVRLSFGSDAPVTPLDPWLAIATAVTRTRGDETPWQPEEAITLEEAIAASARSAVKEGEPADLVVLGRSLPSAEEVESDPNAAAVRLRTMPVEATIIAGAVEHGDLGG